jgi:pimeloyl-ACP methyl ester carboxylesterase
MQERKEKLMHTGMAELKTTRLYYEAMGEGLPLVLIGAGGGLDSRQWDDQFQIFSYHSCTIRYDVRGVGRSDQPSEVFSHVQDLYELLEFLHIEKVSLLGLSFGAGLALDFSLAHPEKVAALIVVAPLLSGYTFSEVYRQKMSSFSLAREQGAAEAVQYLLDSSIYLVTRSTSMRERVRSLLLENTHLFEPANPFARFSLPLDPEVRHRLNEISAPMLIVMGEQDQPDIHTIATILEQEVAKARRVEIAGAAHMINLDQPETFNHVVLNFLAQCGA